MFGELIVLIAHLMQVNVKLFNCAELHLGGCVGSGAFSIVSAGQLRGRKYAVKTIKKAQIMRVRLVSNTLSEIRILSQLRFPFLVQLQGVAQDSRLLHLIFEYLPGIQVYNFLQNNGKLPLHLCRHIIAQVVLCLQYIHSKNIIYRDLKPQNIMIQSDGFIKLIDFGMAKQSAARTYTLCGTPHYMAPQIFLAQGYGKSIDWWAVGVLLYELSVGALPFESEDNRGIFEQILRGLVRFPQNLQFQIKDLIKKLLVADVGVRLGSGGISQVIAHPFFEKVDWERLKTRKSSGFQLEIQQEELPERQIGESVQVDPNLDPFLQL